MVQGGTQALSRSLFAVMIPKARSAEFFGFFSISSKLAGILGPLVFGVAAQTSGEGRLGILTVTATFLVGIFVLSKVNIAEGREEADAGAPL